jgi:hypothetical protein
MSELRSISYEEAMETLRKAVSKLEPEAAAMATAPLSQGIDMSIAISLKRIADALENTNINDAVYNATYNALHQHWRDRA